MANNKKKNLKELNRAHGNEKPEIRTMEQLLGNTGVSKFGTLDVEEYKEKLNKMDWSEISDHAVANGFFPGDVENIDRLKKTLVTNFVNYASQFRQFSTPQVKPNKQNKKASEEMRNFLEKAMKS